MGRYVSEYEDAELANIKTLSSVLGSTVDVVDAFHEVYICLERSISLPPEVLAGEIRTKDRDERLAAHIGFGLMLAIRQQLLASTTSLLRGHGVGAMIYNRRAIEFCVFILRMHAHPELSQKWLDAQRDYEEYLESFSGRKKLFTGHDPAIKYLEHAYDVTSKHLHGSLYALGGSILHGSLADQKPRLDYFDIPDNSERLVPLFFQMLFTHRSILAHLPSRFRDQLSKDGFKTIKAGFADVKRMMETERQRWSPYVTNHLAQEKRPQKRVIFALKRLDYA